jgi:hypothetical protein
MGSHLKHEHNINKYTVHVKRGMRCVFKPGKVRWEKAVLKLLRRGVGYFPLFRSFSMALRASRAP